MKQPIDLRPDHAKIVHEIIARHLPAGVSVRVFGSRAKWTAKPHSDLDLALKGKEPLPRSVLGDLAEAFSESDLPFRVDVVDWHTVAPSFQAVIDRDAIKLPWPKENFASLLAEPVRNGIYKPKEFHGRGCKIVNMGELFAHSRMFDVPMKRVELTPKERERFLLKSGDLLFARRSLTAEGAGKCSIILEVNEPTTFESSIIRARPDPAKANPLYLYYFFSSQLGYQALDSIRRQVAVAGITGTDLASLPIPTPPEGIQTKIADTLSLFDKKIELNRQMNETLEQQAQAIFRDWFVDFGPVRRKAAGETDSVAIMGDLTPDPARAAQLAALFPDAFGDDGLPVGWQRLHLSAIASQGKGSINPQGQPETVFEHYSLPAFDKGQEPSMDAGSTIKSNKTPVPLGSILLSKLNPETLRVWLPNDHAGAVQIASTEFLVFIPKPDASRSLLFALFRDPDFRTLMQGMVTGTSKSHQRISPPALLAQEVIAADAGLFPAFSALVEPMLERLLASRAENKYLAETRDYLLPRLMSGTVRVARESEAA